LAPIRRTHELGGDLSKNAAAALDSETHLGRYWLGSPRILGNGASNDLVESWLGCNTHIPQRPQCSFD